MTQDHRDLAVAIAEDVGRVPTRDAEHSSLESRCKNGFDKCLPGLEVLAADRSAHLL